MRGTPRINSMNPTQIILITGKLDCLPNANKIPIGKDATIPVTPTIRDKVNPPIFKDSTKGRLIGKITLRRRKTNRQNNVKKTYQWIGDKEKKYGSK